MRYKRVRADGKNRYAHRLTMEAFLGRMLGHQELVHHKNGDKLDNRLENLEIMLASVHCRLHTKGRTPWNAGKKQSDETRMRISTVSRGSLNGNATLTERDVLEIVARLDAGEPRKSIVVDYGVTRQLVYQIAKRKIWKHILAS